MEIKKTSKLQKSMNKLPFKNNGSNTSHMQKYLDLILVNFLKYFSFNFLLNLKIFYCVFSQNSRVKHLFYASQLVRSEKIDKLWVITIGIQF